MLKWLVKKLTRPLLEKQSEYYEEKLRRAYAREEGLLEEHSAVLRGLARAKIEQRPEDRSYAIQIRLAPELMRAGDSRMVRDSIGSMIARAIERESAKTPAIVDFYFPEH